MKITREIEVTIDTMEINYNARLVTVRPKYDLDGEKITIPQQFEIDLHAERLINELRSWIESRLL